MRLIAPDGQLLLGVVTAMLGAPFFLWLILRLRSESMSARRLRERLGRAMARARCSASVTATFAAGAVTGIVGPNGAGKTTLLRAALG